MDAAAQTLSKTKHLKITFAAATQIFILAQQKALF